MERTLERKIYEKNWRLNNIERRRELNRNWWNADLDRAKKCRAKFLLKNPDINQINKSRIRAKFYSAPGSFTHGEWVEIKSVYGFACVICFVKESEEKLTIDHKIPLSKGGTNYIDNIQPLCLKCNASKRDKTWFASCPLKLVA